MSCFPCFKPRKSHSNKEQVPVAQTRDVGHQPTQPVYPKQNPPTEVNNKKDDANPVDTGNIAAKTFTFRELATATKNFRQECLIGEGGFGRLFRGTLQPNGQVVAVKQLDKNSMQGNKEFLVEILMLSLLHHPNLVHLIGYCADGDQRLLVYEYMSRGSVEDHLLDVKPDKKPLDWVTRMKIASGTAQGLEYLHEKANPPIIYRDLKSSNIMLDEEFNPRLLDYGLAKLGGNKTHVTPRVMGNYGYCAPEYERYGELTLKSDVYSFGVVLLELITGRRALDTSRPTEEQNLVSWAQPIFRDPKRFPEMADPLLGNEFPVRSLNQAVGVAAMCLQDEAAVRPLITDVVAALSFLAVAPPDEPVPATLPAPIPLSDHHAGDSLDHEYEQSNNNHEDDDHHSGDSSDRVLDEESNTNQHLLKVDDHQNGDRSDRVGEERNNIQHVPKDDDLEDRGGLDYESWDSSVSSDSEEEYQQGKVESIKLGSSLGHQGKLEFEVASMSSSSISSSDDESHRGSINQRGSSNEEIQNGNSTSLKLKRKSTKKSHKDSGSINQRGSSNGEIQHGNSTSLKLKRKSTKKSHKDTVRSSSERKTNKESWNGGLGSSSLQSYQPGIVRLDSKGSSNNELDNGNVGSSTKQESSRRSRSGSIG